MRKNKGIYLLNKYLIINLLILILVSIIFSSSAFSQRRFMLRHEESEEIILEKNIKISFIEEIYIKYANMEFEYIYQNLHPEIKELISEREYVNFQKENFEKYNLRIEAIELGDKAEIVSLPRSFNNIVNLKEEQVVHRIKVSYTLIFTTLGSEHRQDTEKNVFILVDGEELYLLWDPSVID
ncbi:hypothetical protein [Natronospora cellulosivora (SeqCode)]